ncbi:MlaD family protein [Prochlorococcus sp. MIT 1307]|uniref:MlaD family protein n=1 Tax=Prochlorococcus sp. MIT 1307 TaxID=3096219 RepID=UPI002A74C1AD|nr:MlaD family protein [Prochlorococcus sp. MIT 1307]
MRRSVRDAIVGLSIVGGIIAFGGIMLWLRGIKLGANSWQIKANFSDASGLSERSPVTYRGILVGEVGAIEVRPEAVQATIKIDKPDLYLPTPVIARVVKNSLLGGDVQVALISSGKLLGINNTLPGDENCFNSQILCKDDLIKGEPLTSISTLTTELERIVRKASQKDIIQNLVDSTNQFDKTQKELESLIIQTKKEVKRAQPIITELSEASAHINNILAAIDDPETLNDIKETASNARSLSKKIDTMGTEVNKLMDDDELMNALRSVTIGLGKFFNEVYPSSSN